MNLDRAQFLRDNLERFSKTDRIFLNNPVVMQGMGMAPLVVAATSGQNALMLALAVLILVTPTRVIGSLLMRRFTHRFSILYYSGTACLLYILVYFAEYQLFGHSITLLGIYLPLLVMDPLVMRRYSAEKPERPRRALSHGMGCTAGFLVILFFIGLLREFLAAGTLMGYRVIGISLLPLAAQPAGGLILVGALCAVWRGSITRFRRYVFTEASHGEQ